MAFPAEKAYGIRRKGIIRSQELLSHFYNLLDPDYWLLLLFLEPCALCLKP